MQKKQMLLLGAKAMGLLIVLSCLVAGSYVFIVIGELKNKIEESKVSKAYNIQKSPHLEIDTTVYKADLDNYFKYSENTEVSLKELISSGKISETKTKYIIHEEVDLPGILPNNCDRYRCIQNRKSFNNIPSNIWKALLGTEDFRFLDHRGVDPVAIARAIVVDIIAMKFIQGGSTLTQQLVKNLFLSNEKKISRKLKEIVYALYIENVMEKDEIVQLYLNEVFWGTFQGIYLKGFQAASIAYFDKSAKDLDNYEATILISLLKGPNYYNPLKGISRLKGRAEAVYNRLLGLELFSDKSVIWSEKEWEEFQKSFENRQKETSFYSYYLLTENHETYLDAFEKLVYFNSIERVKERLQVRTKDADIAVKSLYINRSCESFDCENSFSHYSKVEREKRSGLTVEKHQVGSLLKPIVYDAFIDLGRTYDDIVSTKPITIKLLSGNWTPKDYSRAKEEEISLKQALQKSKNIPLIKVASEVGFDNLEMVLDTQIPDLKKPLREYPAQLLGALELSLEEVFVTYKKFIEKKCKLVSEGKLVFEDSVLNYMSLASDTTISKLARGAFRNALVFGKTGTSNNGLDNWYFAYDGVNYYITWFGVDSERNNTNLRISGASTAFAIFQDFINHRGKSVSEIICEHNLEK